MRKRRPYRQRRALEIRAQRPRPLCVIGVCERYLGVDWPADRVCHENVEPAERGDRALHSGLDRGVVLEVEIEGCAALAVRIEHGDDLPRRCIITRVRDRNPCTLAGVGKRNGASDTPCASSYEDRL